MGKRIAKKHVPETEEYNLSSFVYRARKPFDKEKLYQLLKSELPSVIRGKGLYWLSEKNDNIFEHSQVGKNIEQDKIMGIWWCVAPIEYWPEDKKSISKIKIYIIKV